MDSQSLKPYPVYLFEYRHNGSRWMIEVPAESEADAWQRICRMQDATYLGEQVMVVPARLGSVARAMCWIRNFLRAGGQSVSS